VGLALQEIGEAQLPGRGPHASRHLGGVDVAPPQAERKVVEDRHVRIQRVGLEHHRDVALLGRHRVHDPAIDRDRPGADRLQTREHA
jgi:hypothetical protein